MGSYISIGLIYGNLEIIYLKNKLENLLNYLIDESFNIESMKVCKDTDGEEWIEYNSIKKDQISKLYDLLGKYYYGQLRLKCNVLGLENVEVTIRIEKEEDYFGFLLDLSEAELIKLGSQEELNNLTEKIINFITDMYKSLEFDYAFCDNEAEIKYSPAEFKELKNDIYSIVVIPLLDKYEQSFDIIKSNWHIDGLSIRNLR